MTENKETREQTAITEQECFFAILNKTDYKRIKQNAAL